jgi:hypothetical protein
MSAQRCRKSNNKRHDNRRKSEGKEQPKKSDENDEHGEHD